MKDAAFYMQYLQMEVESLSNSTHSYWESISMTVRNNEYSREDLTATDTYRMGYEGWQYLSNNTESPYFDLAIKD